MRRLLMFLVTLGAFALSACLPVPSTSDESLLIPAGALAAALSENLDAARLGENTPQELVALITDQASRLPVALIVTPEPTFPYLITVSDGTHAVCLVPDFAAIAAKTPGRLEFSVTSGACVLDAYADEFQQILDARRG